MASLIQRRLYSIATAAKVRMAAWQLNGYDSITGLTLNEVVRVPAIERPNDVLIKVCAASLNPIDTQMANGFGRSAIGFLRQLDQRSIAQVSEFPLILGRDCSGIVTTVGANVRNVKPGDEVWCVLGAQRQGTLAEYAVASCWNVSRKPKNIDHKNAASIPYVGCTVYSALRFAGRLHSGNTRGKNVLVHGGAGGIGTFAIQLLKAWGATVTTTCRQESFPIVKQFGVDNAIDYSSEDAWNRLIECGPYDVILDSVFDDFSRRSSELLSLWRFGTYISITNPLLNNCDQFGLVAGTARSTLSFAQEFLQNLRNGRVYAWAYVIPDGRILTELAALVEQGRIRPVIEKVYAFDQVPQAMEHVAKKRGRGKTVIDISRE